MPDSSDLPSKTDVLIIGGGLAGLALADHLSSRGQDFRLVEARNRLGGRIRTHKIDDAGFDLGPSWFWPGQTRMAQLSRRLGLEVFEQYSRGDPVAEDGQGNVRRGMGWASMEGSYRLQGGMGELINGLRAQLSKDRIFTGFTAKQVHHQGARVSVHLESENGSCVIEAKKVVLAMPPRIAAETFVFQPKLPRATWDAMQQTPTWMAGQAKIVAIYDQPHWRDTGLSGDAMSQRGPMVEIHDASPGKGGPYALFGFVGIPAAARQGRDHEIKQMAKDQLVRLFGEHMASPLEIEFMDWAQEPTTATALDFNSVGHLPAYGRPKALTGIWDDSLLLGSTELGRQYGGYLEGALEVAEDIAAILN